MEFKTGGAIDAQLKICPKCPGEKSSINTLDHQQKYKTLLIWATSTENVLINTKNAKEF